MWTFPILLDSRPAFLHRAPAGSLLLAPLGNGSVLSHLRARLASVTTAPPVIVTRFETDAAYAEAIRRACPDAEAIQTLPAFVERFHTYEPSDRLLLADPSCFAVEPHDPGLARLSEGNEPRSVRHLVAFDRGGDGTKEYVDADASGRVRAIQRYYDLVTWPFAEGIACSLVPVACLRVCFELPFASLSRLRTVLTSEGVPSRDVVLERGAVNLSTERGLLAMNERLVHSLVGDASRRSGARSSLVIDPGARLHPSASVVGPVLIQDGAEVAEGAQIIGPTVIGTGSLVGRNATVAQSVIGAGQRVAPGSTVRHRVFLGDSKAEGDMPEPRGDTGPPRTEWETSALDFPPEAQRPSLYPSIKRAIDAVAAAIGLVLLAPFGLLIAALIKLESRGPVHFGHAREGRGGRPFRCWKFRTMVHGADVMQRRLAQLNQMDGPQFKVARDPRRTRVGRVLTKANLDEIPQLWNVLVGEMSLVGPRPSPFRENQVCVPWREGRLSVRPGITGLWQICRHDRDKGDFHQWIYYDLLYVRNLSLWVDLKILVLTMVSFARGGYIPLAWLLSPETYGERRTVPRGADSGDAEGAIPAAYRTRA